MLKSVLKDSWLWWFLDWGAPSPQSKPRTEVKGLPDTWVSKKAPKRQAGRMSRPVSTCHKSEIRVPQQRTKEPSWMNSSPKSASQAKCTPKATPTPRKDFPYKVGTSNWGVTTPRKVSRTLVRRGTNTWHVQTVGIVFSRSLLVRAKPAPVQTVGFKKPVGVQLRSRFPKVPRSWPLRSSRAWAAWICGVGLEYSCRGISWLGRGGLDLRLGCAVYGLKGHL